MTGQDRFKHNPQTDADVHLLLRSFPTILPDGSLIPHDQVERVLRVPHNDPRYKTAVSRWRKVLIAERCVYLDGIAARGKGFISLTPDEMVRFGNRSVRAAGRKLRRAMQIISLPEDKQLSADTLKYRGLLSTALEKIANDHRTALRDVTHALAPLKQLPRRSGDDAQTHEDRASGKSRRYEGWSRG